MPEVLDNGEKVEPITLETFYGEAYPNEIDIHNALYTDRGGELSYKEKVIFILRDAFSDSKTFQLGEEQVNDLLKRCELGNFKVINTNETPHIPSDSKTNPQGPSVQRALLVINRLIKYDRENQTKLVLGNFIRKFLEQELKFSIENGIEIPEGINALVQYLSENGAYPVESHEQYERKINPAEKYLKQSISDLLKEKDLEDTPENRREVLEQIQLAISKERQRL